MATFDNTANNFIGRGLTFPIQLKDGKPPINTGKKLLEASLRDIMSWVLGTKFFLGEYGGKIKYLLQEPDNGPTLALLRHYTDDLIKTWEKRVTLVSINITRKGEGVIYINLIYKITNTQLTGSFVYPYYTQLLF